MGYKRGIKPQSTAAGTTAKISAQHTHLTASTVSCRLRPSLDDTSACKAVWVVKLPRLGNRISGTKVPKAVDQFSPSHKIRARKHTNTHTQTNNIGRTRTLLTHAHCPFPLHLPTRTEWRANSTCAFCSPCREDVMRPCGTGAYQMHRAHAHVLS